jgi:membrane protein YqaA with SNARE-associated domain
VDAAVIYLAARDDERFWIYPLLACAGSSFGAALTYWIGKKIGEQGLSRFVPERRLARLRKRVKDGGALAMAVPALLPPPFPLTPFILTSGALQVDPRKFFVTFAAVRLLRFGAEAVVARSYGRGVLSVLQSDTFRAVVFTFVFVAVVGTMVSAALLWARVRASPRGGEA